MAAAFKIVQAAGALVLLAAATPASAYPWMINHGYASCTACHVDPSGAGQLTAYGRAQSDLIVRWHLNPEDVQSGEPSPTSGFLWGLLELPQWLNISGNIRGGAIGFGNTADLTQSQVRPLLMATDLNATVTVDRFVGHVSAGFGLRNVGPAAVISLDGGPDVALVSREHWLGVKFLDDSLVVRAGRIPVPYGLRNNEHTSWVRLLTRTDGNVSQQHGLSVFYGNELLRFEVMALLGNYQLRPDAYRERGYSGYFELAPLPTVAVGVSSKATYAGFDIDSKLKDAIHQSHGVFARWSPVEWFTLMGEGNAMVNSQFASNLQVGETALVQADFIPIAGLHLVPALESTYLNDGTQALPSVGVWGSVAWYALPHTEFRIDTLYRESFALVAQTPGATATGGGPLGSFAALLQVHLFF